MSLALAAAAGALLFALSLRHPGLRLVDFLSFASRPDRLLAGQDWLNGLYPVGYPALIGAGGAVVGSRFWCARLLAAAAGAGSVYAVARWLHPVLGAWLLAQPLLLQYGATEGTDLPAVALGFGALALAPCRPLLAGAVLGAGLLVRYTAGAALPAVLLLAGRRGALRALLGLGLATVPHWGAALVLGRSVLPDQSFNLAVGAGAPTTLAGAVARWPSGLWRAVAPYLSQPAAVVGVMGLGLAALVDRRARALLLWAAVHLALVALAFANPRLLLPTLLIVALGLPLLAVRWRWGRWAVGLAAAVWGVLAVGPAWERSPQELARSQVVAEVSTLPGPLLSTDPWVHRRVGTRLEPSVPPRELGGDPRALTPAALAEGARQRGFSTVVIDRARVSRTYPALAPLLAAPPAGAGLERVAEVERYVVYRVVRP